MKRFLRYFLPPSLEALALLKLAKPEQPLLSAFGFSQSFRSGLPVDEKGEPIPWIPYCAVSVLRQRLRSDLSVLEYGSGYSTLFFASRVGRVVAVEHDRTWANLLKARLPRNARLLEVGAEEASYVNVDGGSDNDVVFIDGIHRVACFHRALEFSSRRGVIILDDSERPEYAEVFDIARSDGYRSLPFEGHKAGSAGVHTTTFFYRDGNCLDL